MHAGGLLAPTPLDGSVIGQGFPYRYITVCRYRQTFTMEAMADLNKDIHTHSGTYIYFFDKNILILLLPIFSRWDLKINMIIIYSFSVINVKKL
jgi:hypothetical protein